jgi:hypothetical protein
MSSYIKATNFYTKDALLSGNPSKIIKGAELDDEFNAISIASTSKADTASPSLSGVPLSTTAVAGTSTNQIATTSFVTVALQLLYPVGAIFSSTSLTNPGLVFGFGTWVAFGAGRVAIGAGGAFTGGGTGGSADAVVPAHTHALTDPGHAHPYLKVGNNGNRLVDGLDAASLLYDLNFAATTTAATTGITISSAGVPVTNANLQPYIVVYMWNRTA